jgi:glycosyl transferase family 8
MPKDARNRPRTPFSFQRFYIPALQQYQGRAIYLDSDMQVFSDIAALWRLPFQGADLLAAREPGESGRRPQFSVMLLDCSELNWHLPNIIAALDRGELTYETLMYNMTVAREVRAAIDPSWNSLESYVPGETNLLHYTDMPTQPWVSPKNPNGALWVSALFRAVDAGYITRSYIEDHVRQGYVRPSLLYQVDHRVEQSSRLPGHALALDSSFLTPHERMTQGSGGVGLLAGMRKAMRRLVGPTRSVSGSGQSGSAPIRSRLEE